MEGRTEAGRRVSSRLQNLGRDRNGAVWMGTRQVQGGCRDKRRQVTALEPGAEKVWSGTTEGWGEQGWKDSSLAKFLF